MTSDQYKIAASGKNRLEERNTPLQGSHRADLSAANVIDGASLSLKANTRKIETQKDFCGMCQTGSGGCTYISSVKNSLDASGIQFDMDAATGYKRLPGTAGAHPIMQRMGQTLEYEFMSKQAGSLVPARFVPESD